MRPVVVIAAAVVIVIFAATLLRHRTTHQPLFRRKPSAVGFITARLKPLDDHSQVLFHLPLYEKDAMQVVGHYRYGQHFNLRIVTADRCPAVSYLFA